MILWCAQLQDQIRKQNDIIQGLQVAKEPLSGGRRVKPGVAGRGGGAAAASRLPKAGRRAIAR